MRKANMTLKQSLQLCQRRRPVAGPIPAFLDQLKTYEGECRSWGHLTAVDETLGNTKDAEKVTAADISGEKVKTIINVGEKKRKAEDIGCDDGMKKKQVVGPIGPPRGPAVKSAAIGPQRGPTKSAAAIGPAMGPPATNKRSNGDGDGEYVDGKRRVAERKVKKMVGPLKNPST